MPCRRATGAPPGAQPRGAARSPSPSARSPSAGPGIGRQRGLVRLRLLGVSPPLGSPGALALAFASARSAGTPQLF